MVREASVKDAYYIHLLDSSIFEDSLGLTFITNDLEKNSLAHYFVYEDNDEIVGYIGSWISDNTTILNFCVKKEYRGKGIGRLLLEEVLKIKEGSITLEVRKSNLKAISFYEKNGFQSVLIRPNYYSNGEDAILMLRK